MNVPMAMRPTLTSVPAGSPNRSKGTLWLATAPTTNAHAGANQV